MALEFYDEELKALVGQEGPRQPAVDEVCKPLIRHWCACNWSSGEAIH